MKYSIDLSKTKNILFHISYYKLCKYKRILSVSQVFINLYEYIKQFFKICSWN
jgi:hypothetical protein